MRRNTAVLIALVLVFLGVYPACAQSVQPGAAPSVYYAGPDGSVRQALVMAHFTLVDDPTHAQVLVLNDDAPQPDSRL
jgi:hypothetical protein